MLAKDPSNTIIGLVRDKASADKKLEKDGFKNVTFVEAAISDSKSLLAAREQVIKVTGGKLDYLINNAAALGRNTEKGALDEYEDKPEVLRDDLVETFEVNVISVINTINTFLPLIKKGSAKKVLYITSGMCDLDLINGGGIVDGGAYSISKAAGNVAIAKYNAKYKDQGVLFFSISPGVVSTWEDGKVPSAIEGLKQMVPGWTGPLTPVQSAEMCLNVLHDFSVEKGNGGSFVSHYGTKQWL